MPVAVELLGQFHPFSQLNSEYLERLSHYSEVVKIPKGKLVFQRGKHLEQLYYLVEGQANLVDASFQSASIDADQDASRYAMNEINPSKTSAVAACPLSVLIVERKQLDLVMAASEAGPDLPLEEETIGHRESDLVSSQINYLDAYAYPQHMEVDGENQKDWMSRLLDSPLFNAIPANNIQQLFSRFEPVEYAVGDKVIEEGQQGDYFYVVASGEARVVLPTGAQVDLDVGDYFGEEALVGDTTRNATVVMDTHGEVMRLSKQDFVQLLQDPLFKYVELDQIDLIGPQVEFLDVRLPVEHKHFRVRGSRNIALGRLRERLTSLDPGLTYVVTDDGGSRSKVAVQLLIQSGLTAVLLNHSDRAYN